MIGKSVPECVMFNRAPVAFLCTLISLDFANRVKGPRAPDLAILALLSSCVAKFVIHPTALHWTSTFGDIICRIRGVRPPRSTIATLFSAVEVRHRTHHVCSPIIITHYWLRGFQGRHLRLVELRYPGSAIRIVLAQGYHGLLRGHLCTSPYLLLIYIRI